MTVNTCEDPNQAAIDLNVQDFGRSIAGMMTGLTQSGEDLRKPPQARRSQHGKHVTVHP
jgi:hypothetical protein